RPQGADGARRVQAPVTLDRDPGRVVTAVFEFFQAGQQDFLHRPMSDVSDNAAHWRVPPSGRPFGRRFYGEAVGASWTVGESEAASHCCGLRVPSALTIQVASLSLYRRCWLSSQASWSSTERVSDS